MIINPYLTPEEATSYIERFKGTSGLEVWGALNETDQKAMLFRAMLLIDGLPFQGTKKLKSQTEAFPRILHGEDIGMPEEIKLAVTLQAFSEIHSGLSEELKAAQEAGVSSYSLDDFSVSFGSESVQTKRFNPFEGVCSEALMLLKPFLQLGGPVDVYE